MLLYLESSDGRPRANSLNIPIQLTSRSKRIRKLFFQNLSELEIIRHLKENIYLHIQLEVSVLSLDV